MAEALQNLAQVTMAEGKVLEAKQLYEEALSIATEAKPEPLLLLGGLHTILGFIAQQVEHDQAGSLRHFEEAIRSKILMFNVTDPAVQNISKIFGG